MKKIALQFAAIALGASLLTTAHAATGDVKTAYSTKVFTTAKFGQSKALTIDVWDLSGTTLAFCIEPDVSLNKAGLYAPTATKFADFSDNVKSLYSLYYDDVVNAAGDGAGDAALSFQLALWELNNDKTNPDGFSLYAGALTIDTAKTTTLGTMGTVNIAADMVRNAVAGAGHIEQGYTFTSYKAGTGQTIVSAVSAVPEPSTYAMLGLGLGLVGFVARRRSKA